MMEAGKQTFFGEFIQRGGTLIENQHLRVLQQRTGQSDALAFTSRKTVAARTERLVQPLRQPGYHVIQLR